MIEPNLQLLCRNLDKRYLEVWGKQKNVFAFAAYKATEIIGFTTGFLDENNMRTSSLYVMPEYQCMGVGSNLLTTAENAAGLIAPNMQLFSLEGAVTFYKDRGYENTLVHGRVLKTKKLPQTVAGVVPVFQWSDRLNAKLNIKVDDALLQGKYQPIFVYVNGEQKIDGVATRLSNGKDYVKFTRKGGDIAKYRAMELKDALYNIR